jgi:hypothetical protein
MGKAIHPSILFRVDISQKPNPMMAFHTPSSLYIRIMYVKCHHRIRLLRGFVFGRYLTLTAVTFLYTKFDSELVYQAEHVAQISNKFYIGKAPSVCLHTRDTPQKLTVLQKFYLIFVPE